MRELAIYYSPLLALNKTSCNEEDILRTTGFIVDSLYSVFATLGTVPIIRCSRFNAAEAVARDLDNRFRESLRDSRNTLFTGMEHRAFNEAGKNGGASAVALTPFSFQRPLLIILDRVLDLATPLHHAWTYQSLLHDIVVGCLVFWSSFIISLGHTPQPRGDGNAERVRGRGRATDED